MGWTNLTYKQLLGGLLTLLTIGAWSPSSHGLQRVQSKPDVRDTPISVNIAGSDDDLACAPREQCCKICRKGKACGNSCIRADYNCHKGVGCACDEEDVCD